MSGEGDTPPRPVAIGKDGKVRLKMLSPNRDGTPWYARTFRITSVRVFTQASFFALFVFLLWTTWFSRLGGYPVSLFLEVDPLVGIATALSTHTVYRWLWRGLFVLIPTLLLGRVFCNWMCPYGAMHQFFGWVFNIRSNRDQLDKNRYRPVYQLKYYVLTVMLVMAALGSLQIGLLDPIALLVRTFTAAIMPASDLAVGGVGAALAERGVNPDLTPLLAAPVRPTRASSTAPGSWV